MTKVRKKSPRERGRARIVSGAYALYLRSRVSEMIVVVVVVVVVVAVVVVEY